jgi:hypothetical protein
VLVIAGISLCMIVKDEERFLDDAARPESRYRTSHTLEHRLPRKGDRGPTQTGRPFDEAWLQHIAPVRWNHINLTGDYSWRQNKHVEKGGLQPIRVSRAYFYFPFRQVTPTSAANRAQRSPACCARHASDGLNARGRRA